MEIFAFTKTYSLFYFSLSIKEIYGRYKDIRRAIVVTAQINSTKPEVKFCTGSNSACGVSEIHDGENL